MRGKQHTYMRIEDRVTSSRSLTRDEALRELVTRYFRSHGPATAKDLRWWSSLTLQEIARGVELAAEDLQQHDVEGVTYWTAGGHPGTAAGRGVTLLQAYDEYTVAFSQSKGIVDLSGAMRDSVRLPGAFNQLMLHGTQVIGTWKRTITRETVDIEVDPVVHLSATQLRSLEVAAREHARFLGVEAVTRLRGASA